VRIPAVADIERDNGDQTRQLMASIDHLIVPQHFAAEITGQADPRDAVRRLHEENPRTCTAVTCGRDGCFFIAGAGGAVAHQPAFVVASIDTTGCGDVFHGAYAACLAQGESAHRALCVATVAAGLKATRPGGRSGIPDRATIDRVLAENEEAR